MPAPLMSRQDEQYINQRVELTKIAKDHAYQVCGYEPAKGKNYEWAEKWSAAFHAKMKELAQEKLGSTA